jgi:hypothetical protein
MQFPGVIAFPVAIAVEDSLFPEFVAWFVEQRKSFGSPFDRARFSAVGALGKLVSGDDLQQLANELILLPF